MSSLEIVKALASIGAVKRANKDREVDVESERGDESGRSWVLGVGLNGIMVLGGEWWWSLAVAGARRAITTADQWVIIIIKLEVRTD